MVKRNKYNVYNQEKPQQESQEEVLVLEENERENRLVLYNDDVNTFDFVIECLIQICGHTLEQAEQCTILVHYKGKCVVKTGSIEVLKPMHQKLLSKGLTSEVI